MTVDEEKDEDEDENEDEDDDDDGDGFCNGNWGCKDAVPRVGTGCF
jgi:hypothetical protein